MMELPLYWRIIMRFVGQLLRYAILAGIAIAFLQGFFGYLASH